MFNLNLTVLTEGCDNVIAHFETSMNTVFIHCFFRRNNDEEPTIEIVYDKDLRTAVKKANEIGYFKICEDVMLDIAELAIANNRNPERRLISLLCEMDICYSDACLKILEDKDYKGCRYDGSEIEGYDNIKEYLCLYFKDIIKNTNRVLEDYYEDSRYDNDGKLYKLDE